MPASEIKLGPQPGYRMPDPDKRSFDDWIQFGKEEELNGRLLSAMDVYRQTLAKFPDSFVAGKAAGRLAAGLLRFEEAKNLLEPLHLRDTTDTEISYYLGIAYDGLEMLFTRARHTSRPNGCHRFVPAAALRLGELLARTGDLGGAERHLSESARLDPKDLRTLEELVAVKSAMGRTEDAHKPGARWDIAFPAQLPSSR